MEEKHLFLFAFFSGLIGVFGLFLLSSLIHLPLTAIQDLEDLSLDTHISVQGKVHSLHQETTFVQFAIQDETGSISAVVFGSPSSLQEDTFVILEGTLKEYKGEREIIVEKIVSVS